MSDCAGRRRRWSDDFKRRVVAEASAPGLSVAAVARRYALNANQIFNWRRRYGGSGEFLPVALAASTAIEADRTSGEIEITLASGHRVRITGSFDAEQVSDLLRSLCR